MTLATAIQGFGLLCGAVLLAYGVWFLFAPDAALAGTYHQLQALPYVMGGRYFFFGALLIAALLYGDAKVLFFLLAGFAGLGLFDGVLYWNAAPLPHIAVGILAGLASLYYLKHRKGSA
ncbi:hypothetical protein [uncultured Tateyamaria sp.]|uniref:hypothetical protein n=1 Tax=Tateyamaria sp. 1078 TaxID=3417464 RepID=UPI002636D241|nr:hypothetical protein [uncultured Tateyamaria sp.]